MNTGLAIIYGLLLSASVSASEVEVIEISEAQLFNLGVKLGKLQAVNQVPLLYAPATVTIPPGQEYLISAAQAGLVNQLNVAIGDQVTKDQVLATIKSPELLGLQQQFLKAVSSRRLAKAGFDRDKKLLAEGVIAERRWQETRARYYEFISKVNETRQLLEISGMSKTDIKQLANNRSLTSQLKVRTPISGVVLERKVVAGQRIDMLAPLYRIANLKTLWLDIQIPQEQIGSLKKGDKVLVNNSDITANITLLGHSVNSENQSGLARAVITSGQHKMRLGQTVTVQIIQSSEKTVYKLPNAGIAQNEGHYYIFIRNDQGFLIKNVTVMGKESNHSIITAELSGQEQIAIQGTVALKANWLGLGTDKNSGGHSHGGH